ncbi:MAG: PatB family C-S lyase [Anaerolineales bacterium]
MTFYPEQMMTYNFNTFPERRGTDCAKWDYYLEEVLPMWVADMDFVSPPQISAALIERAQHGVFGYPLGTDGNPRELKELREVIQQRLAEQYKWQIKPEDLVFLPGVARGFNMACHMFAGQPGSVVVETPLYKPILEAPAHAGMERRDVTFWRDLAGEYRTDWDDFTAALQEGPSLFILCNPHNPLGRVFTQEELERKAEACLKAGVVICSDEIHCDLVYSGQQHIPVASLAPEIAANTITLMAPSKTFNIPGLQFSFAVVQNRDLRKRFIKAQQGLVGWINVMGLAAALAAYRDCQDWLDELLLYLEDNRDFLANIFRTELPLIEMSPVEGTYLAWLDCRKAFPQDADPYRLFLEQGRVAFNDGASFGKGGQGFVRLNFGCPRPMLQEALERMKKALLVTEL